MESIIERFEKATNKKGLTEVKHLFFHLPFASAENSIKLKLLKELLQAKDLKELKKNIGEIYVKELFLEVELKSIDIELKEINKKSCVF
jgi:hypothetical protein